MNSPMQNYIDASSAFFGAMIDAHADKLFIETMKNRVDKIARDICVCTDERVTNIMQGQLSICYELADGMVDALNARKEKANSLRGGGFLDEP